MLRAEAMVRAKRVLLVVAAAAVATVVLVASGGARAGLSDEANLQDAKQQPHTWRRRLGGDAVVAGSTIAGVIFVLHVLSILGRCLGLLDEEDNKETNSTFRVRWVGTALLFCCCSREHPCSIWICWTRKVNCPHCRTKLRVFTEGEAKHEPKTCPKCKRVFFLNGNEASLTNPNREGLLDVQQQQSMAALEAQPPPVAAMPVQAYAPPAMDDKNVGAPSGGGQDLSAALAAVNLSMYEAGLRELGVSTVGDIVDLEEADCQSIGMKKLEVKRLMRRDGPELQADDLAGALKAAQLSEYEDALRELGCTEPDDLRALEEADMMEIGMKRIEIKRLGRLYK